MAAMGFPYIEAFGKKTLFLGAHKNNEGRLPVFSPPLKEKMLVICDTFIAKLLLKL